MDSKQTILWSPEELEAELANKLGEALDARLDLRFGPVPDPPEHTWIIAGGPTKEHIEASPHLRGVIVPWAGIPKRTRELLLDRPDIAVHNLHHNASATAEMALALLLAAAKRIVPADQALRAGDWAARFEPGGEVLLEGRRVVIYGYGAIGKKVAHYCRALGMEVHAIRRGSKVSGVLRAGTPSSETKLAEPAGDDGVIVYTREDLDTCLQLADVLVIAVPLTPETEASIGARELALLPADAVLVNIARGPVVQEEALYDALETGKLGAAGLDVWYRYPESEANRKSTQPSRFPFGTLNNVVLSPHRAGNVDRGDEQWVRELARLLNAIAAGEPLPNRVDLALGY